MEHKETFTIDWKRQQPLPPAVFFASGDWRCPNCGKGPTVRDYMAVFERCLQCGWYQELSHEARRRLLHNGELSRAGDKPKT